MEVNINTTDIQIKIIKLVFFFEIWRILCIISARITIGFFLNFLFLQDFR